jgi:MFS-type transporter involved in bile tolerance (Atg22 family)
LLGLYLYLISPIVKFNVADGGEAGLVSEHTFFRFVHISLMVISVVLITIGSAKAKRATTDRLKFKTILIWFSIALLIILIAIPWPFSPLASRPFFRTF